MKDKLHKALVSKYEAERDEALATLEVYFNNPAGIGEHPQVVEEMAKMVEKLENAQGCLEQLSLPILNNY
jgi:methylaspartate ammonia-lyase|tara:strand:+ start:149 stop:358 length:210 start_codon:yes stop_codon:yes gene_type:complete